MDYVDDLISGLCLPTMRNNLSPEIIAREGFDKKAVAQLRSQADEFASGEMTMTALDFFFALERHTLLKFFHLLPRKGRRNSLRNGLQQSYGDHNRLLALGIDRLLSGDQAWYETRVSEVGYRLENVFSLSALNLNRRGLILLWLTAALHDYGKIINRSHGLDAEDALFLAGPLIEALCAPENQAIVRFGIRNHDLIEYILSGETPVQFISTQLDGLEPEARTLGYFFLGIIQLAGAASLGEGRVTKRKVDIYSDCLDGSILADSSIEARLARLLFGEDRKISPFKKRQVKTMMASLDSEDSKSLAEFMSEVVLRGWGSVSVELKNNPEQLIRLLSKTAEVWNRQRKDFLFVIFDSCWQDKFPQPSGQVDLLNGTRALYFG